MNKNLLIHAILYLSTKGDVPAWFKTIERNSFSVSEKVWTELKKMMDSYLNSEVEIIKNISTGKNDTAYKICGVADFKEKAIEVLIKQGAAFQDDFSYKTAHGEMNDNLLTMVFNTYCEQRSTLTDWQIKMNNEDWLNLYPAARFVRRPGAISKRQRHIDAEGMVKRWDDFAFWTFQNGADIGGFDVPWGPFGYNSYMIQVPVERKEAEKLGLVRKGERIKTPNVKQYGVDLSKSLNGRVDACIEDVTPSMAKDARKTIIATLGPEAIGKDGKPTLDAMKKLLAQLKNS